MEIKAKNFGNGWQVVCCGGFFDVPSEGAYRIFKKNGRFVKAVKL